MSQIDNSPVVLVVDDEPALADVYTTWLREEHTVRTAYDGSQALEQLDDTVDVVLLDRRMPGLTGNDVLQEIHARGLTCRVAMVTAIEPDFDILDMKFDDYLVKPVTKDDLVDTVSRLIKRATYDEQVRDWLGLISKKAALDAKKSTTDLAQSEEYAQLEREISMLQDELDATLEEMDEVDFQVLYRDLPKQM